MLIRNLFITLILGLSFNLSAKDFGLGFILGDPTGISSNYFLSSSTSLDAALSFDLDADSFHLHSTYLTHHKNALKIQKFVFNWFWGAGARVRTKKVNRDDKDTSLGPRVSIGINKQFRKIPIEVFIETSITMDIIPKTDADFDFALGGRYYF